MAIKKQFLKSKPVCKVTFEFPSNDAVEAAVVGDFNNWDTSAHPLKKLKNGKFKAIVPLESGNNYEFKYVVDGAYINEETPDAFAWNDYANAENSVLEL